jgi:hypothetical protein
MANVSQQQEEPRPDNLNIIHCHYCNNTAPISKTCTNCHEIKNIDEFYKINNKNQRHRSQCKKCENKKRVLKFKNKGFVNSWYDKKPELLEKVKLLLNIYDKKELFKHVPEISPWMLSHAIKKNIIQIPIC